MYCLYSTIIFSNGLLRENIRIAWIEFLRKGNSRQNMAKRPVKMYRVLRPDFGKIIVWILCPLFLVKISLPSPYFEKISSPLKFLSKKLLVLDFSSPKTSDIHVWKLLHDVSFLCIKCQWTHQSHWYFRYFFCKINLGFQNVDTRKPAILRM